MNDALPDGLTVLFSDEKGPSLEHPDQVDLRTMGHGEHAHPTPPDQNASGYRVTVFGSALHPS